ncbi:MAG: transcriptional regulator [Bacteroidetes bacterium]|nr:MAG: transcriptional regulator [Bacteroidota bacterium]
MKGIITGDIIGSRGIKQPEKWLEPLKKYFNTLGTEPNDWQFFRGDSFQLQVTEVSLSLQVALRIKALVKSIKGLDVRMAIGIGEVSYHAPRITEANGDAFVFSGKLFEKMKKKTLAIKTPWEDVDEQINICLDLALLVMDKWSVSSAEVVQLALASPDATQTELAKKLDISQGRISDRQRRAGLEEILRMERHFRKLINTKLS